MSTTNSGSDCDTFRRRLHQNRRHPGSQTASETDTGRSYTGDDSTSPRSRSGDEHDSRGTRSGSEGSYADDDRDERNGRRLNSSHKYVYHGQSDASPLTPAFPKETARNRNDGMNNLSAQQQQEDTFFESNTDDVPTSRAHAGNPNASRGSQMNASGMPYNNNNNSAYGQSASQYNNSTATGGGGGGNYNQNNGRSVSGSSLSTPSVEHGKQASVFTQLIATLWRQLLQKKRGWVITLLEIILPAIFTLILVIVAYVDPPQKYDPMIFASDTQPMQGGAVRLRCCYNGDTAPELMAMIRPCTAVLDEIVQCASPGLLPVENFCVVGGKEAVEELGKMIDDFSEELEIPNLDDMILIKWIVRTVIPPSRVFWDTTSRYASLQNYGNIYFLPQNSDTQIMRNVFHNRYSLFKFVWGGFFDDRGQVENFVKNINNEGKSWAFIDVKEISDRNLDFIIMTNRTGVPWLNLGPREQYPSGLGVRSYGSFFANGFLSMQKAVNDHYFTDILGLTAADIVPEGPTTHLTVQPMGIIKHKDSTFLALSLLLGPFVLVLAFLFPISQLAKRLVEEKEQRLREATMIMGLTKTAFFSSWLLIYYVQMILAALLVTFVQHLAITQETNFGITFLMYLLFVIATINMAAMFSTFFGKAKIAALIVPLLYFVISIPAFAIPDGTHPAVFHALSIFCPTPLAVALRLQFGHEVNRGIGINNLSNDLDQPYPFRDAIIWTVVDGVVYIFLMIYFDMVIPKEWGTTWHPLCIFRTRRNGGIWPCGKKPGEEDEENEETVDVSNTIENPAAHMPEGFADTHNAALQDYPMTNAEATVNIFKLRKEFELSAKETNVAVNDLHLRMFPDGITVLLGHNGAGKTTVMNMMTGMMPPTSGDVRIYGKSIRHDMQAIRRDIGFCPQHNILWDDLTCMEHLQYFARLKGMSRKEVDSECIEMLVRVDLIEKKDVLSVSLSGGQKRKLSVAIAFMGRARLVLLDEPTAGMDVAARRHTWDVLKDMSQGRTILLTTHYMDEADLLGSGVAIMSRGGLHSYGTPMFLKNNLGTGYVMRIALSDNVTPDVIAALLAEVQSVVPGSELREVKGPEASFALSLDESHNFADAIRHMESDEVRRALGVVSVSMSVATLEDVFLGIAHEETRGARTEEEFEQGEKAERDAAFRALEACYLEMQKTHESKASSQPYDDDGQQMQARSLSGMENAPDQNGIKKAPRNDTFAAKMLVVRRQMAGLLLKRFHHARRDYFTLGIQIVAPILCIVFAMALSHLDLPTPPLFYFGNSHYEKKQMMNTNNCEDLNSFWSKSFSLIQPSTFANNIAFAQYLFSSYDSHPYERFISMDCKNSFDNNVLYVNASSLQAGPQSLNEFYQAKTRDVSTDPYVVFSAASWPLPYTDRESGQVNGIKSLLASLFVLIPFSFIPSVFTAYIVRERECKSKHLQFVSGANFVLYWLSNFIFDIVSYLMTVVIAFIIFACFVRKEYIGSLNAFFATALLFLFYGLSTLGMSYFVSYFFSTHSTAQTVTLLVCFISGFILVVLTFFLENISESSDSVAEVLVFFFRFIPPFCLGDGLKNLALSYSMDKYNGGQDPFAMDVVGYNILYMSIETVFFFIAAIGVDHPLWKERRRRMQFKEDTVAPPVAYEDEDVARERAEIEGGLEDRSADVVRVDKLRKVFHAEKENQKVAVENLSFGVRPGEVFGFLGTNGAGKTTTMSMLTTELMPTCGQGFVGGFDVVTEPHKTRDFIGYCPQFDAIMDLLTPVEHLKLFAALRAVPVDSTEKVIDALIKTCALTEYRNIPAGRLSGGNKRKLSVAMALIGGPAVVLLDEPSAGMDPSARRQLWDVISFVAKHSSVLLTTHHLEEVDVLAHRVGIMDQGLMRCLGSLEHLKRKYGNGYELTIQVDSIEGAEAAIQFMFDQYPDAVLVEARQQRMLFTLPFDSTDLASLFQTIQQASEDPSTGIVDYIVQQTSLEQVFMRISAMKNSEDEADRGALVDGQSAADAAAEQQQRNMSMTQNENDPFAAADDLGSPIQGNASNGFVLPHDPNDAANRMGGGGGISTAQRFGYSTRANGPNGAAAAGAMSTSRNPAASAMYAGSVFNHTAMMSASAAMRQSQYRSVSAAILHGSMHFNNNNPNASRSFAMGRSQAMANRRAAGGLQQSMSVRGGNPQQKMGESQRNDVM